VQLSAEIGGDLLLELLGSELKAMERREPQSEEDLEEVEYSMDFGGELRCFQDSCKVRDRVAILDGSEFDHYTKQSFRKRKKLTNK